VGDTYSTLDHAPIVREIRARVGDVSEDEAALVRTLTPQELPAAAAVEHLLDLVDLLSTIREDEAMAEYVYAIAPAWDGTIETLLLAGRVTTAFTRYELGRQLPALVG
jgi:hypothetical protein